MDNVYVGLFLHLFSLHSCLRFRWNDSQEFAAFWAEVSDLSLEGHFFQIFIINFHKLKVLLISNFVLKRYLSLDSGIGKLFYKNSLIVFQQSCFLITENQSFVQHNLGWYIESNHLIFQDISEIIRKLLRINHFNFSICSLNYFAQDLEFGTFSFYCDNIYWNILCFCLIANVFVELHFCLICRL